MAVASQYGMWLTARLARAVCSIRVRRPRDLLDTPAGTRLILMPTHQSSLDPWLMLNAFDRRDWARIVPVSVLATQTFEGGFLGTFRPLVLLLYRLTGAVVLPPRWAGPLSLAGKVRGLIGALDRGETVAIFPEGHLRARGMPPVREFAPGVVYVHRASGAPVVPIAVWMCRRPRPRLRYYVRVGRPIYVPVELDLNAGAEWLRRRTFELYDEARRMDAG